MAAPATVARVGTRTLRLRNLDKVLYPATGFTKGDLVRYYRAIAPAMLPHLRGRPVTRKRFPDGVDGQHFFEKNCPDHRPDWMPVASVASRRTAGKRTDYCLVDEPAGLVWLANLAAIELHTALHTADDPEHPTLLAFDLDPGAPAGLADCIRVARRLRALLVDLGLRSWPKLSGGKGLHCYVPLDGRTGYPHVKAFAHAIARLLADEDPGRVVARMRKAERRGRVFVDWSQNDPGKTTVCVYSLRARERPAVSLPVGWDELEREEPAALLRAAEPDAALERVAERGDPFAPVLAERQALPAPP